MTITEDHAHLVICLGPFGRSRTVGWRGHVAVPRYHSIWQVPRQLPLHTLIDASRDGIVVSYPVVQFPKIRQRRIERFGLGVMLKETLDELVIITTRLDVTDQPIDIPAIVDTRLFSARFRSEGDEDVVPYGLERCPRVFEPDRGRLDCFRGDGDGFRVDKLRTSEHRETMEPTCKVFRQLLTSPVVISTSIVKTRRSASSFSRPQISRRRLTKS